MSRERQSGSIKQPPACFKENFVRCPEVFVAALSVEQYRERLEIYQRAYAAAMHEVSGPKPFVPPFEFEMEHGLGI